MKHLITCFALGIACAAGAQTGLVEFPYNPDADNDDIIGVNDLLELLSLFGGEFAEENLYLNELESAAIYQVAGNWSYGGCMAECAKLPSGKWTMIDLQTWSEFQLQIPSNTYMWLSDEDLRRIQMNTSYPFPYIDNSGVIGWGEGTPSEKCFCETHERPKVEYSYCSGSSIQSCANDKVADGWYPLSGISSHQNGAGTSSGSAQLIYQAFWRWAE